MEQPPALTPEQLAQAQAGATGHPQIGEPQTVKIFGILHLVFGAYGVFSVLSGIVVIFFGNIFIKFLPQTPEIAAELQAQAEMNDKLLPLNITSALLMAVVTALIITAGITLLKKRRSGLKWSNYYAISSILAKIVIAILTVTISLPVMTEMMRAEGVDSRAIEIGMLGGSLIGVIIPVAYPVLTLILLNRPTTKNWFANRPG